MVITERITTLLKRIPHRGNFHKVVPDLEACHVTIFCSGFLRDENGGTGTFYLPASLLEDLGRRGLELDLELYLSRPEEDGSNEGIYPLHIIRLNASRWETEEDFYSVLLPALGAPEWHGKNLDALWDSTTSGMNRLKPPLTIEVHHAARSALAQSGFLDRVAKLFSDARKEGLAYSFVLR